MNILTKLSLLTIALSSLMALAAPAHAEGRLNIYCTVQNSTCEKMIETFAKKYNVDAQFVHNSTGTTLGKIKAEAGNPQADVWFGGTIEPHYQAANLGLLESYRSPNQADTMPQFSKLLASKGDQTSIFYMLVLGVGVNTEKWHKLGLGEIPQCLSWNDLLNPKLKGEVQLPEMQSSGTSYTIVTTLVQLMGEEKAFDYLKKLNGNVSQYVKSGQITNNLARGEVAAVVGFLHSYATEKEKGAPVEAVRMCEGDSYALGGVSILKGARNLENAKKFVDWALTAEAQEIPWREVGVYQIPTNVNASASPLSIDPKSAKLLDLDFEKYGDPAEGKRLTEKWLTEVKLAQ